MIQFAAANSENNKRNISWLQNALGFNRGWDNDRSVSLGVYDDGLKAVVVYHDYNPEAGTISMSSASVSKKWLNRDVLYHMHSYPFDQIGCQAVLLQVSENNDVMLRIAKAYGYEMFRIPRLRGRDEAEMICVLSEEVWRKSTFTTSFLRKCNK